MLHWHPIKELMSELTGRRVEITAAHELANFFEGEIIRVIEQSKTELEKLNELKKIQGVYQKNRIDRICVLNAIKSIYDNNNSHLPLNGGRKVKKERKEDFEVQ